MDSRLVLKIYNELARSGTQVWIDGGWCISALLGRQIRPHSDLDLDVATRDVAALRGLLGGWGFREVPRPDTSSWMFVLGDDAGNLVDVHAVEMDAEGRGVLGPPELGQFYPVGAFEGSGVIDGIPVRCLAPQVMLHFKTSYPPRDIDRSDVDVLRAQFGFVAPDHWP